MMKNVLYLVFMMLFIACSNGQQKNKIPSSFQPDSVVVAQETLVQIEFDSLSSGLNFVPGKNYTLEKTNIKNLRNLLSKKYLNATNTGDKNKLLDSTAQIFTSLLLNKIIPYWYETEWDFNGHTATPNQGTIACGYFVSTTLRDMGLSLNRYKLAQQGPENEAKSIAIDATKILHAETNTINEKLNTLVQGMYFVGLNNHVGYLYKNGDTTYFIHANYIDGKVMIENTKFSEAFYSDYYYIATITANKSLLTKWLTKEEIEVVTE